MIMSVDNRFSHKVSVFHDRHLPESDVWLAGYSAKPGQMGLEIGLGA